MLLRPVQDENTLGPSARSDVDDAENMFPGVKKIHGRTKSFGAAPRKALGNITNRPNKQVPSAKVPSSAQRKALGDITNASSLAKPLATPVADAKPVPQTAQTGPGSAKQRGAAVWEQPERLLGRSWEQLEAARVDRSNLEMMARVQSILDKRPRFPIPLFREVAKQYEPSDALEQSAIAIERPASPPMSPLYSKGTFLDSEQREDLCLSISLSGIREEELVLNVSEEDLLEAYFSDPQQNYGSPPQQSGNEHSEAT